MTLEPNSLSELYDESFYNDQIEGSLASAKRVVPQLLELLPPCRSVIDIGCGTGAWLSVFKEAGVESILGVDGGCLSPGQLLIPQTDYHNQSLVDPVPQAQGFDLAISLEVAEHLDEVHAPRFVETLCGASELIVFSAAIPGQGGQNHVNERWPSYWADLFAKHGYQPLDIIRPNIWSDKRVEWWYRQNMLVFVHESRLGEFQDQPRYSPAMIDLVHPDCFAVFRGAIDRHMTADRDEELQWAMMKTNHDHKQLCEQWIQELLQKELYRVALYCAGGSAGLGPYLIARCADEDIQVKAYVDHFPDTVQDRLFQVPVFGSEQLESLRAEVDAFVIASPGYAKDILAKLSAGLDELPALVGSV